MRWLDDMPWVLYRDGCLPEAESFMSAAPVPELADACQLFRSMGRASEKLRRTWSYGTHHHKELNRQLHRCISAFN
jgi:hypothetical protein